MSEAHDESGGIPSLKTTPTHHRENNSYPSQALNSPKKNEGITCCSNNLSFLRLPVVNIAHFSKQPEISAIKHAGGDLCPP